MLAAMIKVINAAEPNLPIDDVSTMEEQIDRTILLDRLLATLTVLFALLAVALSTVGLYGVMTFTVLARTREIGIRMALGASQFRVLGLVLRDSATLIVTGIALGLPGAIVVSRLVKSFVYGLATTNSPIYLGLSTVLAAVTLAAACFPARRAASADPMQALRYE